MRKNLNCTCGTPDLQKQTTSVGRHFLRCAACQNISPNFETSEEAATWWEERYGTAGEQAPTAQAPAKLERADALDLPHHLACVFTLLWESPKVEEVKEARLWLDRYIKAKS